MIKFVVLNMRLKKHNLLNFNREGLHYLASIEKCTFLLLNNLKVIMCGHNVNEYDQETTQSHTADQPVNKRYKTLTDT